ncbi:MAG: hypothetical protein KDK59_01635 [Simkania sp.]|nr:hypothetical protein [Simkania sp.]
MSTIQNAKVCSFPSNYMVPAYGSETQMTARSLTLIATLAGTYFSFKYLPPGLDKWAGGIILVTGAAIFIFGSLSKVLEFMGEFFRHMPPPKPESYPYPNWDRRTSPYYIPLPKTGGYRPPSYDFPRSYPPTNPYETPYKPPSNPHRVPVVMSDGKTATLSTSTYSSGPRPHRKSASEEKRPPSHLPTDVSKSCDLSRSWHFGGSSNPYGSGSSRSEIPVSLPDGSGGSLHVGSKSSGHRPAKKTK